MKQCKRYYIEDCGQGFTAPACAICGTPEENNSWFQTDGCIRKVWVKCEGNFNNCDIVEEVKAWSSDES